MARLVVFSICKDEAGTVGELLDRIPEHIDGVDELVKVVVSDGSSDDTAAIARRHGAYVIEGRSQHRLAVRFQQAVEVCLELGADIAVGIDGDLQFRPEQIPELIAPIVAKEADFVAANRFQDPTTGEVRRPPNMPVGKFWANRLGARIVGRLSEASFDDVTCGFRAYNRRALLSLNIISPYTYTQESFQLLAYNRLDIVTIPVDITYYPGRQSRVVTSFWQFLAGSALNILRAFRDFAPLRFFLLLGSLFLVPGLVSAGFVGIHWLRTQQTSPYTSLGLVGAYLFSVGVLIWVVGLMADMMGRSTRNQERVLRELKAIRFGADGTDPTLGTQIGRLLPPLAGGVDEDDAGVEPESRRIISAIRR